MGRNFELKKSNTLEIFHALQKNFCLSRKELETLTDLSWGSVSAICNDLLQKGILVAEKKFPLRGVLLSAYPSVQKTNLHWA